MPWHAEAEQAADGAAAGASGPQPRRSLLADIDWRSASAGAALAVADWLTVYACLVAAWWIRRDLAPLAIAGLPPLLPLSTFVSELFLLAPWSLAFAGARLYARRMMFWDETRRVLSAATLATLFALGLSFAGGRAPTMSRLVIGIMWAAAIVAVPIVRYHVKVRLVARIWSKRVLIVGAGETGRHVAASLLGNRDLGYRIVGFVDDDRAKIGTRVAGLPVYGPLDALPDLVAALEVKDLVAALPALPRQRLLHLVASCEARVQSIRIVPDLLGLASVGVEAEDLDGILLLHMRSNLAKPWNLFAKRGFDIAVATVIAVVLAPLLAAIALAIRLDSRGPVFYRQERMGRDRRLFRCRKFRTMYVDSEVRLRTYLTHHPPGREEWDRFRKLKSFDPRVTAVGRVLRRFSLDELPQLLNVVRNEMSLVGPRPYLPSEAERMGEFCDSVLMAAPGMTGLWQVSGRNDLTFEQRLRVDAYYVRNWSLWMDVMVLVKTITAVAHGRGAY